VKLLIFTPPTERAEVILFYVGWFFMNKEKMLVELYSSSGNVNYPVPSKYVHIPSPGGVVKVSLSKSELIALVKHGYSLNVIFSNDYEIIIDNFFDDEPSAKNKLIMDDNGDLYDVSYVETAPNGIALTPMSTNIDTASSSDIGWLLPLLGISGAVVGTGMVLASGRDGGSTNSHDETSNRDSNSSGEGGNSSGEGGNGSGEGGNGTVVVDNELRDVTHEIISLLYKISIVDEEINNAVSMAKIMPSNENAKIIEGMLYGFKQDIHSLSVLNETLYNAIVLAKGKGESTENEVILLEKVNVLFSSYYDTINSKDSFVEILSKFVVLSDVISATNKEIFEVKRKSVFAKLNPSHNNIDVANEMVLFLKEKIDFLNVNASVISLAKDAGVNDFGANEKVNETFDLYSSIIDDIQNAEIDCQNIIVSKEKIMLANEAVELALKEKDIAVKAMYDAISLKDNALRNNDYSSVDYVNSKVLEANSLLNDSNLSIANANALINSANESIDMISDFVAKELRPDPITTKLPEPNGDLLNGVAIKNPIPLADSLSGLVKNSFEVIKDFVSMLFSTNPFSFIKDVTSAFFQTLTLPTVGKVLFEYGFGVFDAVKSFVLLATEVVGFYSPNIALARLYVLFADGVKIAYSALKLIPEGISEFYNAIDSAVRQSVHEAFFEGSDSFLGGVVNAASFVPMVIFNTTSNLFSAFGKVKSSVSELLSSEEVSTFMNIMFAADRFHAMINSVKKLLIDIPADNILLPFYEKIQEIYLVDSLISFPGKIVELLSDFIKGFSQNSLVESDGREAGWDIESLVYSSSDSSGQLFKDYGLISGDSSFGSYDDILGDGYLSEGEYTSVLKNEDDLGIILPMAV
jgi:hypothetical protein